MVDGLSRSSPNPTRMSGFYKESKMSWLVTSNPIPGSVALQAKFSDCRLRQCDVRNLMVRLPCKHLESRLHVGREDADLLQ